MSPTPFEVQDEDLEAGIRVFTIRGELDLNTAPALEDPLTALMEDSEAISVLIDLSACEFIDSTGIAVIVRAWQHLDRDAGDGQGRLVLCCSNDQVQRILKITGVGSSISMQPDRDAALSELRR